jgi:hypothetical protein
MVVYTCNPNYLGGSGRRITVWGQTGKKLEVISEKQTKSKRTRGMVEGVDYLPNKCEALSSMPSTTLPRQKKLYKENYESA